MVSSFFLFSLPSINKLFLINDSSSRIIEARRVFLYFFLCTFMFIFISFFLLFADINVDNFRHSVLFMVFFYRLVLFLGLNLFKKKQEIAVFVIITFVRQRTSIIFMCLFFTSVNCKYASIWWSGHIFYITNLRLRASNYLYLLFKRDWWFTVICLEITQIIW